MAAGKPDGSDRAEHTEDVHQVNVMDRYGREVERLFDQIEAHVVVKAHKNPQEQAPGQVKRYQCPGGYQMQVGDDEAVQAFFARDEMGGTGTEKYEQEGENSAYQSDAYRSGPPRGKGSDPRGDKPSAHASQGISRNVERHDFSFVPFRYFFGNISHGYRCSS